MIDRCQLARKGEMLLPDPVDLAQWLARLFRVSRLAQESGVVQELPCMPIAFKTTKMVCKIFEGLLFSRNKATTPFEPLLAGLGSVSLRDSKINADYPIFHNSILTNKNPPRAKLKCLKQLQKQAQSSSEGLFLYLIRKRMTVERISRLPAGIRACLSEVLRGLRNRLPGWLYEHLPELGFSLIRREDLYQNWRLHRRGEAPANGLID